MTASLLWKLTGYLSRAWITARRVSKCLRHTSITLAPTRMLLKLSPATRTFSNVVLLFSIVTFEYQKVTQTHVRLIILRIYFTREPGKLYRYSDTLRAERSEDRNPLGTIFSAPVQIGPGDHPQWVPGLSRGKAAGAWRSPPTQLAPTLKKEYSYNSTPPVGLHGMF